MARGRIRKWEAVPLPALLLMIAGTIGMAIMLPILATRGGEPLSQAEINRMNKAAAAAASQTASGPVAAFLGDSYTSGRGPANGGYVSFTTSALGWQGVNLGVSGTGYLNPGTGTGGAPSGPYIDRVNDVAAAHPDIIIVQGTVNDVDYQDSNAAAEQAAVDKLLRALKAATPNVPIVVVGPTQAPIKNATNTDRIRNAIQAGALAEGVPFIDPLAGHWLTPQDYSPDGLHPTREGYQRFSAALVTELQKVALPLLKTASPSSG